jgi:hypothetical protein
VSEKVGLKLETVVGVNGKNRSPKSRSPYFFIKDSKYKLIIAGVALTSIKSKMIILSIFLYPIIQLLP